MLFRHYHPPLKNMHFQNKSFKSVYTINLLDKMSKVKISRIIIPSTILYAVLIFHLSLTSNIGNVKHFLDTTLGHATKEILIISHLSFVLNFLEYSLNFVERQSIDPGHFGIYFGLGILLYLAFLSSGNYVMVKYSAAFAIFTGTAYGILNEVFQMFIPYRVASVADALSNLLGLVLAQICIVTFILLWKEIQKRRNREEEIN